MRLLVCLSLFASCPLFAAAQTINAKAETDPIPAGFTDTDDTAIWLNPKNPERSLILGTSKYDEDGLGGIGVYDLQGRQLQFFPGNKMNSVDIVGNVAVASNRSEKSFDVYKIEDGVVSFVSRTLVDFSPYGLCLDPQLNIYLPTKSGVLYRYGLDGKQQAAIDLSKLVSAEQDRFVQSVVTKEAQAEGEEDELEEHLAERFILENCAYDDASDTLYVGMENLGIWALQGKKQPELAIAVQGSWTDIGSWGKDGVPRVTDDIEGIDVVHAHGGSYLFFSSQGISEFTVYDLSDRSWVGNFKATFGDDAVTETDGISVQSGYFSPEYPEGLMVVHDDENIDAKGTVIPGNYKVISLSDVWSVLK